MRRSIVTGLSLRYNSLMSTPMHIKKSSGLDAEFSKKKLEKSLRSAGADETLVTKIASQIEREIKPGMNTTDIYALARSYLKRHAPAAAAAKYSLKRAIMELGPTGYPFEQFFGQLLAAQGYKTHVSVKVDGVCVSHEIDVLAYQGDVTSFIECKFHNHPGYTTNVKVPLYIYSRFLDIREAFARNERGRNYEGWVVTNTSFSKDALTYGTCKGLKLIGWTYPKEGNLQQMIEMSGLHPVTCLTSINEKTKAYLMKHNVVLCRQAREREDLLRQAGLHDADITALKTEIDGLF